MSPSVKRGKDGSLGCLDRSRVRQNSGPAQFSDGIPLIVAFHESRTDVSMLIHENHGVTKSQIPIQTFTISQSPCKMALK
jgi:hypothetical protein